MNKPLKPGSTIGILGDGQLGRMTAHAAQSLGYKVHIFGPEKDAPAKQVTAYSTTAAYEDNDALTRFAGQVDVITLEFENVPLSCVRHLEKTKPVHPSSGVLEICRNRVREKEFISSLGIGTAPFRAVNSLDDLQKAISHIPAPAILKTAEMGYDGKGQFKLASADDIPTAWQAMNGQPAILEGFVNFTREISVIAARSASGEIATYPAVENIHKNHILDTTKAPADISEQAIARAREIAEKIASAIDLIGVICIEMFLCEEDTPFCGQQSTHSLEPRSIATVSRPSQGAKEKEPERFTVLVNELAPRPHNSGHWTIEAAETSQFEQLVRAVCGLPLGSTAITRPAIMKNLIGADANSWQDYLAKPGHHLHLYGKSEPREGRKMGHVTILD